jgi:hypothetical protein
MIIKVEISEETWARMLTGKRVEGTLGLDKWTGKKDFNAFHRKARKLRDKIIKKLPWGWVKESKERIKVYESVPKELGMAQVLAVLNEEHEEAHEALMAHELDLIEFC